jgi:hypothetical protein
MQDTFEVGDKVEILGNARGTCWELGHIANIDGNGEALINYGDRDFPIYGMGIRKPLSSLRKVK